METTPSITAPQNDASQVMAIPARAILCKGIRGIGGSDPVIRNISPCLGKYQYDVSFDVPVVAERSRLQKVVGIGDSLSDSSEAEYSAVCNALANLYRDHSYIIQDYSCIRAEICEFRLQDFTPKLGECREACEEVKNHFLDALERLQEVSVMFADATVEPKGGETDLDVSATLMSCSEELKKIHDAAKEQMNRFDVLLSSEHGVQNSPLSPTRNSGAALDTSVHGVRTKHALSAILGEVLKVLGCQKPIVTVNANNCGVNEYGFKGTMIIKKINSDDVMATSVRLGATHRDCVHETIYDALVMLETKFHIVIKDIHHDSYRAMRGYVKSMNSKFILISEACADMGQTIRQAGDMVSRVKCCSSALLSRREFDNDYISWLQLVETSMAECYKFSKIKDDVVQGNARISTYLF